MRQRETTETLQSLGSTKTSKLMNLDLASKTNKASDMLQQYRPMPSVDRTNQIEFHNEPSFVKHTRDCSSKKQRKNKTSSTPGQAYSQSHSLVGAFKPKHQQRPHRQQQPGVAVYMQNAITSHTTNSFHVTQNYSTNSRSGPATIDLLANDRKTNSVAGTAYNQRN